MLARKLTASAVWGEDPHLIRLWIYLLLSVRWKDDPVTVAGVQVRRGQVLKSYRSIAAENEWRERNALKRWSTSRVKRMLAWLEAQEMICTTGTEVGTLIEVLNFAEYQDVSAYGIQRSERRSEQVRNNKKKEKKITTLPPHPNGAGDRGELFPSYQDLPLSNGRRQYPEAYERAYDALPARSGGMNKAGGYRGWRTRVVEEGVPPDELEEAARHYAAHVRAADKEGTSHVMQASTFFGPSERWAEDFQTESKKDHPYRSLR